MFAFVDASLSAASHVPQGAGRDLTLSTTISVVDQQGKSESVDDTRNFNVRGISNEAEFLAWTAKGRSIP